jgi:hypothetical protein
MDRGSSSENLDKVLTSWGWKWFQDLIFLAAEGVVSMVDWQSLGS